jgi:hypothetical protein
MAQGKRANVRMQFGDGSHLDEWLSLSLRDTYTDPLGDLKFDAAPSRQRISEYREKLRKGDLVTVFVNNVNQGGYIIQTVETSIDQQTGVTFSVSCNTPLITPYQGHVKHPLSFKSQTYAPVQRVISDALAPFGFQDIIGDVASNVSALTGIPIGGGKKAITVDALKADQATAQEGETAYQFCSRLVTRIGVALHMAYDGILLLTVPDYSQSAAYTLVQSADPNVAGDRFIGRIRITDTNDNQFSECRVRGQQSDKAGTTQTAKPSATVKAADVLPARSAYRSHAAAYKPLDIVDKNATSIERCQSVAKLALGIRAKEAFVIEGEVSGFVSTTGRVWTTNTIVNVRIDAIGFREPMFILERVLTRSREGGDVCRLRMIPVGALLLGDLPSGA